MGAQRALLRWSWRQLRREWRQQLLVLSLVAIAIAIATFFATLTFYLNQPPSVFAGSATHRLIVFESEVGIEATVREIADSFGTVELTTSKTVSRDGSTIEFLMSDPRSVSIFGAEPIRLIDGHRPTSPSEIGLSRPLADQLDADIGTSIPIDGQTMMVVGLLEDPASLGTSFAIVAEGRLVEPTQAAVLVSASDEKVFAFVFGGPRSRSVSVDSLRLGDDTQLLAVSAVFALASVAMIEVALMCSAGFAVLGQRRLRELGVVSAIGASTRQVSHILRLNGIMIGFVGGLIGVAIGFGASIAAQSVLENAIGWRIATWSVPWMALVPFVLLSMLTCLGAAWWPARNLARTPVVDALAARRPRNAPSGRKGILGVAVFIGGATGLSVGVASGTGVLAVVGLLGAITGLLLATPVIVAAAGRLAPHLPLSPRLALRTVARNQTRSAAAIAALTVALGIPAAVILTSASADANLEKGPPNLPDNWVLVWPEGAQHGDVPAGFDADEFTTDIEALAQSQPLAQAVPIYFAARPDDPNTRHQGPQVVNTLRVARILSDNGAGEITYSEDPAWIATPDLLSAIGSDPGLATSDALLLGPAVEVGFLLPLEFEPNLAGETGSPVGSQPATPLGIDAYRSLGSFWITEQRAAALGATPFVAGWLLTKPTPYLAGDLESIYRRLDSSLVAVTQQPDQTDDELRRNTLIVGCLVALAILAVMVSLLRTEAGNEDRTLAALGAPRRTRRWIAAATTGFLAFGAALLALPAGYLALLAITSDRTAEYPFVLPLAPTATLVIGVPVIASLAAYLLTSSQPENLGRPTT